MFPYNYKIPQYTYTNNLKPGELMHNRVTKSQNPELSNMSTSRFGILNNNKGHELLGFRRFAKTYLAKNSRHIRHKYHSSNKDNYDLEREPKVTTIIPNIIYFNGHSEQSQGTENKELNNIPQLEGGDVEFNQSDGSSSSSSCLESPISSPINQSEQSLKCSINPTRVIYIRDIPSQTSIKSIVSQIYGGPLESLQFLKHPKGGKNKHDLELVFLKKKDATNFLNYARTSLFQVNGQSLFSESSSESKFAHSDKEFDSIVNDNMSRCLILKRYYKNQESRKQLSKEFMIDHFDVEGLKKDFERYGNIIEVTPIISRKLCISISYYNIASSMQAMQEYDDPYSDLHKKYFKEWVIWYGKDTTDRACIRI